jgi:hypothetical protein
MPHWTGSGLRGTHATHIEMVGTEIAPILRESAIKPLWTGISLGVITTGKGAGNGRRSVKLLSMQGGILLKVRQSLAVQEVRIWSDSPQMLMHLLARRLRDNRIPISFRKESG